MNKWKYPRTVLVYPLIWRNFLWSKRIDKAILILEGKKKTHPILCSHLRILEDLGLSSRERWRSWREAGVHHAVSPPTWKRQGSTKATLTYQLSEFGAHGWTWEIPWKMNAKLGTYCIFLENMFRTFIMFKKGSIKSKTLKSLIQKGQFQNNVLLECIADWNSPNLHLSLHPHFCSWQLYFSTPHHWLGHNDLLWPMANEWKWQCASSKLKP